MDSLTQVVLGAAVGEAALGRRVGNRALLWGGIAGTIPDLDVLSSALTDPISALAYHRAFTHGIPFAILAAPILGLAVHRLYGGREGPGGRGVVYPVGLLAFFLLLLLGSYLMPLEVYGIPTIAAAIAGVVALFFGGVALRQRLRRRPSQNQNAGWIGWTWLFFLAIVTHPLLDCFTSYGTQLFQPFVKLRIAWNTISVLDPFYTLPFLLLLILAARFGARSRVRRRLNTVGLLVSSTYLVLTIVNHFNVSEVVHDTLSERGIAADRTVLDPGLGSNLLWSATAHRLPDTYYLGQYSLLDTRRTLTPFLHIEGRHRLLAPYAGDRELEILRWFTQGYYTVLPAEDGVYLCDLRYGLLGGAADEPGAYLFKWRIDTTARPVQAYQVPSAVQKEGDEVLSRLWDRLKGI